MPHVKKVQRQGFALVISLSLMALVLLLVLALSSLLRVEQAGVSAGRDLNNARLNAELGAIIALGQLQVVAGPDQRAVARADLLRNDARVNQTLPTASPRRFWVGVSHSDGSTPLPDNKPVRWLVSGLDRDQSPAQQLAAILAEPVELFRAGSTANPIQLEAGRLVLNNVAGSRGAFAWIVDDDTQKAKLAPANPAIDNTNPAQLLQLQRHVLPGFFDLGEITGISGDAEGLSKSLQLRNIQLISSANAQVSRERFFDYTLAGFGVLANTREGGLKRDLTAAFERAAVFNDLFQNTTTPPYVVMDEDKFNSPAAAQLRTNGYIHFNIFRDYYNLRNYVSGGEFVPGYFREQSFFVGTPTVIHEGRTGPHNFQLAGHPYGSIPTRDFVSNVSSNYAHNPINPVLAFFQQNGWLEYYQDEDATNPRFITHAQVWAGIYNPYNVRLRMQGANLGPALIGYPQVLFWVEGNPTLNRRRALEGSAGNVRRIYSVDNLLLPPGSVQYLGFASSIPAEDAKLGDSSFSTNLQNAVNMSAFRIFPLAAPVQNDVNMRVEFPFLGAHFALGVQSSDPVGRDHISQAFFSPFAFDHYLNVAGQSPEGNVGPSGRPAKIISRDGIEVPSSRMSSTEEAYFSFRLRTTREPDSPAIRPLIDGNLRATWNNPRWDYNMGLPLISTFSPANQMENEQFINLQLQGNQGFGFWGNGDAARVILFDIPRDPLVSIGQLQHAAAGRFSYEPAYIVGNSYANVRIPLNNWFVQATDTFMPTNAVWRITGQFPLFDASYLVNEVLFDGYTFTTIPQGASETELGNYLTQTRLLQNPRYVAYEPDGLNFNSANLHDSSSGRSNTGFVLADGAFNINSTSLEAWEVFLSGTKGLPFRRMNELGQITGFEEVEGVRYPRVQTIFGEPWEQSPNNDYWIGFRSLTRNEIRVLAEMIVSLIRERGPFYNLSEFVNRRLENSDAGRSAVLQTALDRTVNSGLPGSFESPADGFSQISSDSTQGAGFPGQLLQGDILQALAPYMQTRSDTFTIRSYGEVRGAAGNQPTSRVWYEMIVQRVPDPVVAPDLASASGFDLRAEMANPASRFGRQFRVVSFRWMSGIEDDV